LINKLKTIIALFNLVDNSLKATSGGSKIIIDIEEFENTVCIYIKDFGRGMIDEDVKKVLEPFYRVDKSRSRKDGGVGLGLSICDEIIKRHNGRLEINSKLGEGTTVKIYCEKEGKASNIQL
jgi:signal transduction histidine kinase